MSIAGVDPSGGAGVFADVLELHRKVAHDGGQLDLPGRRVDRADDHGVQEYLSPSPKRLPYGMVSLS